MSPQAELDAAVGQLAADSAAPIIAVMKDAARWRAMRELLIAVDWNYGDPPTSVVVFALKSGVVFGGPKGADAIADAAIASKGPPQE